MTVEETSPLEVPPAPKACCSWRQGVQVPLLLLAAAGLGFAGQQTLQNVDVVALLATGELRTKTELGTYGNHCSSRCASQQAAMAGSCATSILTGSGCCSDHGTTEEPAVSALEPANVPQEPAVGIL